MGLFGNRGCHGAGTLAGPGAPVNGLRAPDYFRFDIRVDRTFNVRGQPFVLFGGIQNVTNRHNLSRYVWYRRTNTEEYTEQQGIFPILGFDWRF